ncbi:pitrilysin family protein, partial [Bdellovibrionota bacterium FG-2]
MRSKYILLFAGFVCAAALLFVAVRMSSCVQKISTLGVEIAIEKKVLANGMVVVFVPDPTVPVVSLQIFYRVGAVDEREGSTGLAHLFEHLMFKGTARFGEKQFFQQLEAKGAEVNAYTTRDFTVFYENFVPELLPKALEMEADRMQGLQLSESLLNRERKVVLEERALRTDSSPDGRMQESLWGLAYSVHPYQQPVIGFPQDLEGLTLDAISDFYKKYY